MKPSRLAALTGALLLFALAGCQSPASGPAAGSTPILRVGVTPTMPPMVFREGGEMVGLEVDFARQIGQHLGRPIKLVPVKWEEQIDALLDRRTDVIMSSMSLTPARQMRVAFAKPYLRVGQMAMVRRDDLHLYALGFPSPLPGTVGVQKGTTSEFFVQREFPTTRRDTFTSAEDAVKALVAKRIDLFISDATIVWYLASKYEAQGVGVIPRMLTTEYLAWAVRPGDRELLEQLNAFVDAQQADGAINQTIRPWLPQVR